MTLPGEPTTCKWCGRKMTQPKKGKARLCETCKKRGKPPKRDALWYRLPGSFESGKRR